MHLEATASALSSVSVMAEAMAWLIGDADSVKFDRTTSYHGPELVMIEAVSSNKKRALASFSRLGTQNLDQLVKIIDNADDNHMLHSVGFEHPCCRTGGSLFGFNDYREGSNKI